MSTPTRSFAGIDVSKDHLDLARSQCEQSWQFANSLEGIDALADLLKAHEPRLIVLEATGGYEQLALEQLQQIFPVAIVNRAGCGPSPAPKATWQHLPKWAVPGRRIASMLQTWPTSPTAPGPHRLAPPGVEGPGC